MLQLNLTRKAKAILVKPIRSNRMLSFFHSIQAWFCLLTFSRHSHIKQLVNGYQNELEPYII